MKEQENRRAFVLVSILLEQTGDRFDLVACISVLVAEYLRSECVKPQQGQPVKWSRESVLSRAPLNQIFIARGGDIHAHKSNAVLGRSLSVCACPINHT